jgi:hypothetical protein
MLCTANVGIQDADNVIRDGPKALGFSDGETVRGAGRFLIEIDSYSMSRPFHGLPELKNCFVHTLLHFLESNDLTPHSE